MLDAEWMDEYRRGGLVFDVIDEGSADGPVVVLLHQSSCKSMTSRRKPLTAMPAQCPSRER